VFTGDVVRALGCGGTLVVGEPGTQLETPGWASLLAGERVEAFESAPRYVDELVDHVERTGAGCPTCGSSSSPPTCGGSTPQPAPARSSAPRCGC